MAREKFFVDSAPLAAPLNDEYAIYRKHPRLATRRFDFFKCYVKSFRQDGRICRRDRRSGG
jgi:hypothetical protein